MSQLTGEALLVTQDLLVSRVVGLFLETLLFGVFVVAYSVGAWLLLRGDQPRTLRTRNATLLTASTAMLVLAIAHIVLTMQIVIHGFVFSSMDMEGVYDYFFFHGNAGQGPQFYIYVTQTLIGDGFMLYRLLVVMNKNWKVVIAPCILFLIDIVCGYFFSGHFAVIFYAFSLFTNMLCTTMIMTKVLKSGGGLIQDHWNWGSRALFNFVRYRRVVEAIVQSAAIYSVASISLVVTFFLSPNIGYSACLCAFPPLIGAVFALIVIQIAQKSSIGSEQPVRGTGLTVETVASFEAHPMGRAPMPYERDLDTPGASSLTRVCREEDRASPRSDERLIAHGTVPASDSKKSAGEFS